MTKKTKSNVYTVTREGNQFTVQTRNANAKRLVQSYWLPEINGSRDRFFGSQDGWPTPPKRELKTPPDDVLSALGLGMDLIRKGRRGVMTWTFALPDVRYLTSCLGVLIKQHKRYDLTKDDLPQARELHAKLRGLRKNKRAR